MATGQRSCLSRDSTEPNATTPASIKLESSRGGSMNIGLANVSGIVVVGNNTTINRHSSAKYKAKKGQTINHSVSFTGASAPCHDDLSNSSSDDSVDGADSFFAAHGFSGFSETMRQAKELGRSGRVAKTATASSYGQRPPPPGQPQATHFDNKALGAPGIPAFPDAQMRQAMELGRRSDRVARTVSAPSYGPPPPGSRGRTGHPQAMYPLPSRVPVSPTSNAPFHQHLPRASAPLPHLTAFEIQEQKAQTELRKLTEPQRPVTGAMITTISTQFGIGWRRVFRYLGLGDAFIDCTYSNCSGDVREAVYLLLMEWRRLCSTPTVGTLVDALVRSDYLPVIEYLK